MRLDSRDCFPSGMEEYLSLYGWHFSKNMCQWAVSNMYKIISSEKSYITPYTREQVDDILTNYGVNVDKSTYDYVFVANMCKADYYGSSIADDLHLALFIKDYCEDSDGYKGLPFTRFYADCIGKGIGINWEDML